MLVRRHAGLNKAVSNIVATVILIAIIAIAILIFWNVTKRMILKSPAEKISCFELINEFSIKRACYLNENEVLVEIKRGFDNQDIKKLRIGLDAAVWELTGKKCSDVRIGENYGGYCEIIKQGQTLSYIFDVSGIEKIEKVNLAAGNGELCFVSEKEVEETC